MSIWKSWTELTIILNSKSKIYFFGRSEDWVPKTLIKIDQKKEVVILDNNSVYTGTEFNKKKVVKPSILKNFNKNNEYVIITAEPDTIIPELHEYGLQEGEDFCCTPEIKDWGNLQNMKKNSSDIIFTSSDYFDLARVRSSKNGGGIFIGNISNNNYEKKLDGQYRQFIDYQNNYFVVEYVKKEIHVFDKNFKILDKFNLDQSKNKIEKPNYCGITHSKNKSVFFVVNSASDEISIYDDKNFKIIDKIIFSNKVNEIEGGQCHINDITIIENSLFISYFSKSGLWRKEIFNGGVSEINLNNSNNISEIISGLNQPHSPEIINGQICVLDSLNRNFFIGTNNLATFPGFIRGLSHDGNYFYVGQSEDMYSSRMMGKSSNVTMTNAGIYQFDHEKKISRFLSTPDIMNIHDILVY